MRKLMWLSIGFILGCSLGVYLLPVSVLLWVAIPAGAIGLALLCLRKRNIIRIFGVLLLAVCFALTWYRCYDRLTLSPLRDLDEQTISMTLTATDYPQPTDYGFRLDSTGEIGSSTVNVRIYINDNDSIVPGTQITGTFLLRYTAPGGSRDNSSNSGRGIFLLAYPRGEITIKDDQDHWRYFPNKLRHTLVSLMDRLFPEDAIPFLRALVLGDTSLLDYATDSALSLSGLRHVAAVSGLHVSILFSLVYLFTARNRYLSLIIGAPVLLIFCAMAGFSPSIVRASLMQLLMLLSLAIQKEYDPPTALGFAALIILLVNPLSITSASFQLSVASVAGILLLGNPIQTWLMDKNRLGRWNSKSKKHRIASKLSGIIAVSLSAQIFTTPLTAWYFGNVNLLGILTNLLCLWAVTLIFCGTLFVFLLGAIWLPLGKIAGWIIGLGVKYVLGVAGLVAKFPLSAVYTVSPYIVAWLIFAYVLLGIYLLSKQKKPLLLFSCAAMTLMLSIGISWLEPVMDDYRITMLDVGQGQCILLQSEGKTFMVDCGGSYDESAANTAASTLLSQGILQLDGLILTHHDEDHIGAAACLLQRVSAEVLILPDIPGHEADEAELLAHHTGQVVRCSKDLDITWKDTRLRIFGTQNTKNTNESSLCVLFQTEKCDILITGDRSAASELVLLSTTQLPKLEILVAGHHGSKDSTGEPLLEATRPDLVLISVGKDNNYGHPAEQTLARLEAYGCRVRRTDLEGTIIIRG